MELFALVWEKSARLLAKELGVLDIATGKPCDGLQVLKPPSGYWARVQSGQTPRHPPLPAFREDIDRSRRAALRSGPYSAILDNAKQALGQPPQGAMPLDQGERIALAIDTQG